MELRRAKKTRSTHLALEEICIDKEDRNRNLRVIKLKIKTINQIAILITSKWPRESLTEDVALTTPDPTRSERSRPQVNKRDNLFS